MLHSIEMGNFLVEINQEDERLSIDTFIIKRERKECISAGWVIIKKKKMKQVEINVPEDGIEFDGQEENQYD